MPPINPTNSAFPPARIFDDYPLTLTEDAEAGSFNVRLAALLGGEEADDIRCELFVVAHDAFIDQYTALSYADDDEATLQPIAVNGKLFGMPSHLVAALRRLRVREANILIWVDALCVSHWNLAERSWHAARSHKIFNLAARTIAWLGEDNNEMPDDSMDPEDHALAILGRGDPPRLDQPPNPLSDNARSNLLHLLSRPYWSQLRAVQETAYAQHFSFQYGKENAGFEILAKCLTMALEDEYGVSADEQVYRYFLAVDDAASCRSCNIGLIEFLARNGPFFRTAEPVGRLLDVYKLMLPERESKNKLLWQPDYRKTTTEATRDLCACAASEAHDVSFLYLFLLCRDSAS